MALFSLWQGPIGGITLKRGADPPFLGTKLEDPDAVKMLEFHAASWNEACQREYDHFGWGHYEPQDWEPIGEDES